MSAYKNKYMIRPDELQPGDRMAIKIVAVIGWDNDWAAYYSLTNWSDDEVAENGDKLSEREARPLFPVCKSLRYRN